MLSPFDETWDRQQRPKTKNRKRHTLVYYDRWNPKINKYVSTYGGSRCERTGNVYARRLVCPDCGAIIDRNIWNLIVWIVVMLLIIGAIPIIIMIAMVPIGF